METVKRALRAERSAHMPRDPDSLAQFIIQGDWTTTGGINPVNFLLHDNGPDAADRIVIFGTDENLRRLAASTRWFMDGNFSMAPTIFANGQLYVILSKYNNIVLPAVFALLQRKNQTTYEYLFTVILEKCQQLQLHIDPRDIHLDFEYATMRAIEAVFGNAVDVHGCFFHLCQSTFRKIQQLGLQTTYEENAAFKEFCGMLDALAFLPLNDVEAGMQFVRTQMPDIALADSLLEYFDTNYVTGTFRRVPAAAAAVGNVVSFNKSLSLSHSYE